MGSPDPESARLEQVRAQLRSGQFARALRTLEQMRAREPIADGVLELLGIARAKTGDLDGACAALEEATRRAPSDPSPHYNYAMLLAHMGRLDDAAGEIDVTLYLAPDHPGARTLQQNVAMRLRNRAHRSDDAFRTVDVRPDPVGRPASEWARLECQSCGAPNFMTARVCRRCGSLLSQDEPVTPLE
jgi:Flp pilus assembly protein TadD